MKEQPHHQVMSLTSKNPHNHWDNIHHLHYQLTHPRMHNGNLASIHSPLQQAFLTAEAARFADEGSTFHVCFFPGSLSLFQAGLSGLASTRTSLLTAASDGRMRRISLSPIGPATSQTGFGWTPRSTVSRCIQSGSERASGTTRRALISSPTSARSMQTQAIRRTAKTGLPAMSLSWLVKASTSSERTATRWSRRPRPSNSQRTLAKPREIRSILPPLETLLRSRWQSFSGSRTPQNPRIQQISGWG